MSDNVVISVKNLKTYFYTNERCNRAINGVSMDIKSGKTLCIVGESGCGKSVTATSIMQLLPKLSMIEEGEIIYHSGDKRGDIKIHELERNGKEMRDIRGKDIAMIFQDPMTALNPVYTIGWQIEEMIRSHNKNVTKKEARETALKLLTDMGIPNPQKRIDQYPHEPTTALDVTIQAQIFELMDHLKKNYNTAIMLITHDMGVVCELADDVAVMYMGNIIESGSAEEVLDHPTHPYTRALLKSIPVLGRGAAQDINPIKGSTPDPYNRPAGCQFAPRCDYACPECDKCMPEEVQLGGTHMVRCARYQEVTNDGR